MVLNSVVLGTEPYLESGVSGVPWNSGGYGDAADLILSTVDTGHTYISSKEYQGAFEEISLITEILDMVKMADLFVAEEPDLSMEDEPEVKGVTGHVRNMIALFGSLANGQYQQHSVLLST